MRRNTDNWIARIFSIAAAGAALGVVPTLAGCNDEAVQSAADQSVAADLRQPAVDMTSADAGPTIRRPFLVGSSLRSASAAAREDWCDPIAAVELDDLPTRQALAAAWLKEGLEEHASVAAFARFSIMGLAVGAPPDLIVDAQRASLDELRHARICFGLANRYGAAAAGPGPLRVDDALSTLDLVALAALTAQEGCVGETLGALLAERQAGVASEPFVREALTRIAADERRHAELAWRFVAWASQVGGVRVVDAVSQAVAEAIAATRAHVPRALTVDATLWHAHGRLTCAEAKAVGEEAIEHIVQPALAGLQGRGNRAAVA